MYKLRIFLLVLIRNRGEIEFLFSKKRYYLFINNKLKLFKWRKINFREVKKF